MKARYIVEMEIGNGWENVWSVDGQPATFETAEEAEQAIKDHIIDCAEAVKAGDMEDSPDPSEFRVAAIPHKMTQAKHTPGPWEVAKDVDGPLFIQHHDVTLGEMIATVSSENKANARLIAAAPDLLDALDDLVNGPFPTQDSDFERLHAKANAAIAKARGQ